MLWIRKEKNIHKIFDVFLAYKAVHALVQFFGGIFLIFSVKSILSQIAISLTRGELAEDPQDRIASFLINSTSHISPKVQVLIGFYLTLHGIVNMSLAYGLWKKKAAIYPVAAAIFALVCLYQIYLFFINGSITLLLLSAVDIIYIWLILHEYKVIKES